ncbi:MAG TPA: hypothetical protein VG318_06185, partial [Actinomycetota bacterium]|nr:hypothetical protein [Actinomycetota bacterium]
LRRLRRAGPGPVLRRGDLRAQRHGAEDVQDRRIRDDDYDYAELGNLVGVDLPDKTIDYVVDGFNRRVARKVDGAVTNRYLYGQGLLPVAELNADGTVKSRFVFASRGTVPTT